MCGYKVPDEDVGGIGDRGSGLMTARTGQSMIDELNGTMTIRISVMRVGT